MIFPDPTLPLRLDRLLSTQTAYSRSEVRKLIKAGRVMVDGEIAISSATGVTALQKVQLDHLEILWPLPRYVMLHKPSSTVCTHDDTYYTPVHLLIDSPWADSLHSAGRLDADTTGLVLLTNDGQWNHRLTSPKFGLFKSYLVNLSLPVLDLDLLSLERGIQLHGESKPTLPAQVERINERTVRLGIQEGRYHQVKRMFAALDNEVIALHRESVGPFQLDSKLAPGEWRELTTEEIALV
jgi:16S rRNA pseudouridine516 synthase